ncbi:E3 ubiquitin-protein ligase RSL1-like [Cornus florida]|uniref:E3 ubiquitin-protein ligase RSL1-like n=1 Tax=Cornus florida TaxID=4283 RepID=UPI002897FDC0|nr:E3 ubiquitin-protein ligase RSL1-like [Cornus florida]
MYHTFRKQWRLLGLVWLVLLADVEKLVDELNCSIELVIWLLKLESSFWVTEQKSALIMFKFSKHKLKDEEEASTFRCSICFETMLATSTNKFENNVRCACSFCNDCIAKHIKVSIEQYNRSKIRCPYSPVCGQLLDPLSCRHIIPAPLFDKWCDMLCNLALLGLDTCYCPYRDCSALVIVTECGVGDLVRRSKCPHCKRLFCFQCKQPWHADYECEDSSSDLEFGVVEKRKKWMRCPACKHCVERAKDVKPVFATSVE